MNKGRGWQSLRGDVLLFSLNAFLMSEIGHGGLGLDRRQQLNATGTEAIGFDGDPCWSQELQQLDLGGPLYHTEGAFCFPRRVQVTESAGKRLEFSVRMHLCRGGGSGGGNLLPDVNS